MRKTQKIMALSATIGGVGSVLWTLYNNWKAVKQQNKAFTWQDISSKEVLRNILVGSGIGAVGGFGYAKVQAYLTHEEDFEPNQYLKKVLESQKLDKQNPVIQELLAMRVMLKSCFKQCFGNFLAGSPIDSGSYAKATLVSSKFDIDIIIPFKKNSVSRITEMSEVVFNYLSHLSTINHNIVKIREQGKSIGVLVKIFGEKKWIDIVPGKEINNYQKDGNLNLHHRVKDNGFLAPARNTTMKTNPRKHRSLTENEKENREIIQLFKVWGNVSGIKFSTPPIEYMVHFAAEKYGFTTSIFENLMTTIVYIIKNLETKRIVDIANSNNVISEMMTEGEKRKVVNQLIKDYKILSHNTNYLKEMFPI